MSPRLARHLRDAVPVAVFFVIVALTWDSVRWYLAPEDGPREPLTVILIGVLLALPLVVLESSALAERFRRLPFWAAVLLKTVTYVAALAAIFLGLGLILGMIEGRTLDEFVEALPQNLAAMATAFVLYMVIIFLRQLDRLLGPSRNFVETRFGCRGRQLRPGVLPHRRSGPRECQPLPDPVRGRPRVQGRPALR